MRLAIIASHPIQYYGPWFRYIAAAMGCAQGHEARGMRHEEGGTRHEAVGMSQEEECGKVGKWEGAKAEGKDEETNRPKDQETAELASRVAKRPTDTSNSRQNALRVFYLWDFGVTDKTDKGFGKAVKWDVDLLGGYDHEFVPNVSSRPGTDWFGGLDNPELLQRVKHFAPDAVLQFGYNYKSLINFDRRWNTRRAPLLFRGDSHLLAEDREQSWQSSVVSRHQEQIKRWLRKIGLRLLFKRFACFLAVGKANADYFRAHGVPESKIVRCPHVVDNAFFLEEKNASRQSSVGSVQPEQKSKGLREELGIPDDELVFLFAGKLEKKKQPMQLLEAFLAADLPKATLLFVGSGELERALKERAREGENGFSVGRFFGEAVGTETLKHGNTEPPVAEDSARRVVFLEFQNQSRMPDVYRMGDVLVLPSKGRYETWGLAVNEAACCGLPAIVSSHVGCGPDLIQDGVTGWVFEAGNTEELRRCLREAASDRHRLQQMGSTLQEKVIGDFSYESATRAMLGAVAPHSYCSPARQ